MGAGVSNWLLANSVARSGELGVVSGTALDVILARRLQSGDPGGHMRRALEAFPIPEIAQRILDKFFIPEGKDDNTPFKGHKMFTSTPPDSLLELTVVSNFVEVFLGKEGHDGVVGINYLEKIQMPNLASIYGAMLAGVDYVLMGAGIPREIPGILDKFANQEEASMNLAVEGATGDDHFKLDFNPRDLFEEATSKLPTLKRPKFLAIIASTILAVTLSKKSTGKVDGFIIEGPIAGGHNALPRGPLHLDEKGEPIYGPKDVVDLKKIKAIGLPFYLAGAYGTPERVKEAIERDGATGVQVGTAFAFCKESGFSDKVRRPLLDKALKGEAEVFTDHRASPTSFPFKVALLEGTNSESDVYNKRRRICDLGYLRHPYKKEDGKVGYRCPSEDVDAYVKKGGSLEDTAGRKCLCNGLLANIGLPQFQFGSDLEKPLVTAGNDLVNVGRYVKEGEDDYSAADVIDYLLGR